MNVRISEARHIMQCIRKEEENSRPPAPRSVLALTLKGMIFTSLYACLEYSITQGTQDFLNHLSSLKIKTTHLEHSLLAIALDDQLKAAKDASEKRKWETRRGIFSAIEADGLCHIPDTVFGGYLYNVYPKTIAEIFNCLGISAPPTATPEDSGYFQEITERRNSVAHGRESASAIGRGKTDIEVDKFFNTTYRICSHFLDTMEAHAESLMFVRQAHRTMYQ